jgi:hypothetical protein
MEYINYVIVSIIILGLYLETQLILLHSGSD